MDGTIVFEAGRIKPDVYADSETFFIEYIRDGCELGLKLLCGNMDKPFTEDERWYNLTDEGWLVTLVQRNSDGTIAKQVSTNEDDLPFILPANTFTVFPQGGRGILYWAQDTYQRIEDIALTMRRVMSGSNLYPILSGEVPEQGDLVASFATAKQIISIPGDIQIDRVTSDSTINQLTAEQDLLKQEYFDALHVVDTGGDQQRPSGKDRELRMQAMFQFVRLSRDTLNEICGGGLTFDKLVISNADERGKEKLLLDSIRETIGDVEYQQRVKML